jgi:hypothetical protein
MKAMQRDYLMLWRYALLFRQHGIWALANCALVAGAALAVAVLTYKGKPARLVIGDGLGVALAALAILAWVRMVPGAVRLHATTHAQLVPRLHRRLKQMVALAWLGATLIPSLLIALAGADVYVTAILIGTYMLVLGLYASGQAKAGSVALVLWLVALRFINHLPEPLQTLALGPVSIALGLALLLAGAALALRDAFPRGAERNQILHEGLRRRLSLATARGRGLVGVATMHVVHRLAFQRACLRRAVASLMLEVRAPRYHWSAELALVTMFLGFALAGKLALYVFGTGTMQTFWADIGWIVLLPLLAVQFSHSRVQAGAFRSGAPEQALFRLSPSAPPSARFNRVLAAGLVWHGLIIWCIFTAAMLAISVLLGTPAKLIVIQLCVYASTLVLLAIPLRDYAADIGGTVGPMVISVVLGVAIPALMFYVVKHPQLRAFVRHHGIPMAYVAVIPALAALAVAVAVVLRRRRAMLAAPVALVAGRMMA